MNSNVHKSELIGHQAINDWDNNNEECSNQSEMEKYVVVTNRRYSHLRIISTDDQKTVALIQQ